MTIKLTIIVHLQKKKCPPGQKRRSETADMREFARGSPSSLSPSPVVGVFSVFWMIFSTHTHDSTFKDAFLWDLQKFSCHFHSPCVRDQKKDLQSGSCTYKIVRIWIHIINLQKCFLCINWIFDIVFVFFPQEVFVKPRSIKYPVWLSFLFVFHLQDIGNHSGEKSTAVENRLKFKIFNKRKKTKTNDNWQMAQNIKCKSIIHTNITNQQIRFPEKKYQLNLQWTRQKLLRVFWQVDFPLRG